MIKGDINLFSRKVKEKVIFYYLVPIYRIFIFHINPISLAEDLVGRGTAEPVKVYDKWVEI